MRCILRWTIVLSWLLTSRETSFAVDQIPKSGPQLGIQTWTLRTLNFNQALEFAATHGISNLTLSVHFDPQAPREELLRKKAALAARGLHAYTFGVANTSLNRDQNRRLFESAKLMEMKLIVVEPPDFKIFDQLEELVREFDIHVAVHNHGIRSLYGNPAVLKNLLQHRDPRLGVCLDTGWVTAAGFDVAKVFKDYDGRVFDVHLKDKTVTAALGEDVATDTFIGTGNANLKGLFAEMKRSNWKGVLSLETDSPIYAQNPAEFVSKAKTFFHENLP